MQSEVGTVFDEADRYIGAQKNLAMAYIGERKRLEQSFDTDTKAIIDASRAAITDFKTLVDNGCGDTDASMAEYVNIGDIEVCQGAGSATGGSDDAIRYPLIVPLFGRGNIVVDAALDKADAAIREIVLQAVSHTDPGVLNVTVYDPKLSRILAPFASLPGFRIINEQRDLTEAMQALETTALEVANMMGDPSANLIDYRRKNRESNSKLTLVVLLDYPYKVDEKVANSIVNLMKSGPTSGISFVIQVTPDAHLHEKKGKPDYSDSMKWFDSSCLSDRSSFLRPLVDGGLAWDEFPLIPIHIPERDNRKIKAYIDESAERVRQANAYNIPLLPLAHPDQDWTESTAEGVTILEIEHNNKTIYSLSLNDEHPHAMLTGTSGSGKSNFIISMVYSMSQRYSPAELQIFLLDFKEGLSIASMASSPESPEFLPQAKLLGVNTDRQFGLETLQYIDDEFLRRSKRFKNLANPVRDLMQYRKTTGKSMPRIVLIIDEFQVLYKANDEIAKRADRIIRNIASQGRAFGVHMILATQALSGLANAIDTRKFLLTQSKIRLALQNTSDESNAILSMNNNSAAELRPFEIVVNDNLGMASANHIAMTPRADEELTKQFRQEWCDRARQLYKDRLDPPMLFDGDRCESFSDAYSVLQTISEKGCGNDDDLSLLVGRPVAVTKNLKTVRLQTNLIVLGSDNAVESEDDGGIFDLEDPNDSFNEESTASDLLRRNRAIGSLQMCGLSLALQCRNRGAHFSILNGLGQDLFDSCNMQAWADALSAISGNPVRMIGHSEISDFVREISDIATGPIAQSSSPEFILGFNMASFIEIFYSPNTRTNNMNFLNILKLGAPHGIHTLGWWPDVQSLKGVSGADLSIPFDTSIMLSIESTKLPSFVPNGDSPWYGANNRGLVCQNSKKSGEMIIPFIPITKEEAGVLENSDWGVKDNG